MNPVGDRPMELEFDARLKRPIVRLKIGEEDARLVRVYVQAKENWIGFPTVEHVDLYGYETGSNKPVTERIKP